MRYRRNLPPYGPSTAPLNPLARATRAGLTKNKRERAIIHQNSAKPRDRSKYGLEIPRRPLKIRQNFPYSIQAAVILDQSSPELHDRLVRYSRREPPTAPLVSLALPATPYPFVALPALPGTPGPYRRSLATPAHRGPDKPSRPPAALPGTSCRSLATPARPAPTGAPYRRSLAPNFRRQNRAHEKTRSGSQTS